MTYPSEEVCFCGHPRRWHNDQGETFCTEWGCKCRKFVRPLG